MLIRWPRIVWHLTVTEQVVSSAPKPAASAGGSLKPKTFELHTEPQMTQIHADDLMV